jgi:predicted ATP-binding protein involved in virulence
LKRISKIRVYELLDQYNYKFDNFVDERITMIFAPNGSGKTILLKLINSIFNNDFIEVFKLPFKKIEFDFTDNSTFIVKKIVRDSEENKESLRYELISQDEEDVKTEVMDINFVKEVSSLSAISRTLPFLRRIAAGKWVDNRRNKVLNLQDIVDEYGDMFDLSYVLEDQQKDKFKDLVSVHLVETSRLYDFKQLESRRKNSYANEVIFEDSIATTVNLLSEDIKRLISQKLNEFAFVSQEKDRSFPSRLVSLMKLGERVADTDSIISELEELEKYRRKLSSIGLLENQNETFSGFRENPETYIAKVLGLYIEDTREKLSVFYELEEKITLFLEIINAKYQDKELTIDKNAGFVIKLRNGKELKNINFLSSGEQHILVMYFNLLFMTEENTLFLIDEPEISLHIEWQQDFLSDLQKIRQLSNLDFLVATHSPDIMNGNWSISVGLEDVKDT